jgi:hypothetical protein
MTSGNKNRRSRKTECAPTEERPKFEKFLADISATLVAIPPERVDDEIRNALKKVIEFFEIDRCSLLRLLP